MKVLTQTLLMCFIGISAIAQNGNGIRSSKTYPVADHILKSRTDLPMLDTRVLSLKPKCIKDSSINYYPSVGNNSPAPYTKSEFWYNYQYNVNLQKDYIWDSYYKIWVPNSKTDLTYDSHDNLLSQYSLTPTSGTVSGWTNSGGNTYTYDGYNNRLTSSSLTWDSQSNSWRILSVISSTYNSANLPVLEIYQISHISSVNLENFYKYMYTYDIYNNPLTEQVFRWNTTTSTWVNLIKYTFTSSGNNVTSYLVYDWDDSTNSWQNSQQVTMTYDSYNNQISQTLQMWNTSTNVWANYTKYLYSYDSNNYMSYQQLQSWNTSTNSWSVPSITNFYYNCHTVGIQEESLSSGNIRLYPNPVQSQLNIETNTGLGNIRIVNITGQLVMYAESTNSIDVSSLTKGIYFIQVTNKNNTVLQIQKFVKD